MAAIARPGLGGDLGGDAGGRARPSQRVSPFGDGGGVLARDVGNTETAAEAELRQREGTGELGQHPHRLLEGVGEEDLAADVRVEPDQLELGRPARPLDGGRGITAAEPEAELRIDLARHHVLVGVGFNPRRHPYEHAGRLRARSLDEALGAVELVEAVDHDAVHADLDRGGQLVVGLVVAVHDEPVGRDAGRDRHVQLAAGGNVEIHALLVHQTGHGQTQERLRRVGDAVSECGKGLATARPQVGLVVDEQRGAVLARQVEQVDAAHRQPAGTGVDHRGVGQQEAGNGAVHADPHIDSGARAPRSCRPIVRPTRAASTSHKRACVSSALTPSPIT